MKRIAIVITLFIVAVLGFSLPINCQQSNNVKDQMAKKMAEMKIQPDDKTAFKDESGKVISKEEFNKFLKENSQTYTARRVVKDGHIDEMKLDKLSQMEIDMRKRMNDKISEASMIKKESLGKPAAAFTATTLDGKSISLADLKGKIVVLNFLVHRLRSMCS